MLRYLGLDMRWNGTAYNMPQLGSLFHDLEAEIRVQRRLSWFKYP